MMTSRDRLADSLFAKQIKDRLAKDLSEHPALKTLRNERSRYPGATDEQARRTVQELLDTLIRENPDLGRLLIDGTQISNPHRPFAHTDERPELRQFPTFFRLRGARDGHRHRDVHLGLDYLRFVFETDAKDDYFDRVDAPGVRCLDMEAGGGSWENADYLVDGWHLSEGVAEMRLRLPDTAAAGDVLQFKFTVFDDNHQTSDFVSTIELAVQSPKEPSEPPDTPRQPRQRPPKGDAPEIKEVREESWGQQVPEPFDGDTALRRIDNGNGVYELRYNADNKWLRKEISRSKASEDQAADLRHQFGVVMAALGLAVMGAHQRSANGRSEHDDPTENGKPEMSINELIEWCTSAAAPVVASIHSLTTASSSADDSD